MRQRARRRFYSFCRLHSIDQWLGDGREAVLLEPLLTEPPLWDLGHITVQVIQDLLQQPRVPSGCNLDAVDVHGELDRT